MSRCAAPYGARRACLAIDGDGVRVSGRDAEPAQPEGDLLQAGPLLVAGGAVVFDPDTDREGFSAGSGQFDSDITRGRYPRAALGVSADSLIAVACDGRRSNVDAGLTMLELAQVMVDLGAERAINLDGGGSTTLVHRGHLLNRPYPDQDQPAPKTRRVVSALTFERRALARTRRAPLTSWRVVERQLAKEPRARLLRVAALRVELDLVLAVARSRGHDRLAHRERAARPLRLGDLASDL